MKSCHKLHLECRTKNTNRKTYFSRVFWTGRESPSTPSRALGLRRGSDEVRRQHEEQRRQQEDEDRRFEEQRVKREEWRRRRDEEAREREQLELNKLNEVKPS